MKTTSTRKILHLTHKKTKAAINPRTDTARDKESNVSPWLEDYLDLQSMRMKPITEASIERIAYNLIEWSKEDSSVVLRDFYDDKGIPEDAYYRWVKTYPILKAAHELAKGRIGSRREKGGLFRKMDTSIVTLGLAKYDNGWKEFISWKASLKDQSTSGEITINLPNITTIPMVEEGSDK